VSTTRDLVFWGQVLGNVMKSIRLTELLAPMEKGDSNGAEAVPLDPIAHWSLLPLGEPSNAAGDPGEVAVTRDGAAVIVLSGVQEVALRTAPRQPLVRRRVGRRPADVVLAPDQRLAYVANMFDDSISIVEIANLSVLSTISLGPQPPLDLADQGEVLFYDARLSLDGWYSCHSCHTDGHTCGLLNDNFGDETYGAPKRVISLLGTADTGPWAWNGGRSELKSQIHKSIRVTMQGRETAASEDNVAALEAYVATLSPPPALAEARGAADEPAVARGRQIFQASGCADCHREPAYTAPEVYDVGLADERGTTKFNPPSLRGVSQRGPYFHDNRARRLPDVLSKFHHEGGGDLSPEARCDLLAFLESL
jgi:YVTN family beta-propeller protein